MYLGDNLIQQGDLSHFLKQFTEKELNALILLRPVANPSAFGVAKVDAPKPCVFSSAMTVKSN
jgi:glucose-1-phosphate thymidylyltransferase